MNDVIEVKIWIKNKLKIHSSFGFLLLLNADCRQILMNLNTMMLDHDLIITEDDACIQG